jgi:hypothetical protein
MTYPFGVPTTPVPATDVPVLLDATAVKVYAVLFVSPEIVQLVAGEMTTQVPITVVPIFAVTVYESAGPLVPLRTPPLTETVAVVFPEITETVGAAGATGIHCA